MRLEKRQCHHDKYYDRKHLWRHVLFNLESEYNAKSNNTLCHLNVTGQPTSPADVRAKVSHSSRLPPRSAYSANLSSLVYWRVHIIKFLTVHVSPLFCYSSLMGLCVFKHPHFITWGFHGDVCLDRCFWVVATCRFHLEGWSEVKGSFFEMLITTLMMESASICEMSLVFYRTTWRSVPEDTHIHSQRHADRPFYASL